MKAKVNSHKNHMSIYVYLYIYILCIYIYIVTIITTQLYII